MTEYKLQGYLVNPLGIDKIRKVAMYAAQILQLPETPVDMGFFLESLVKFDITYDVIDSSEMPGLLSHSEACCIPEMRTIYLTTETYSRACVNDPRARFTIFHELGHFFLVHNRKFHRDHNVREIEPKRYLDSEWQANQFAAEILMPLNIIQREKLKSSLEIESRFCVSMAAAQTRYNQLKKRNEI